jgi:2-oxoglutarate dehydrogenase E2 component (dihydrolipoamide succinyltransferase)
MAKFEIVMPKLGESIIEATITKWLKNVGDPVKEDESILEIATDKVDSEIPSPVDGILLEQLFKEGDVVAIGTVIAVIDLGGEESVAVQELIPAAISEARPVAPNRFYSPLVRSIVKQENISLGELDLVTGTGSEGRLTKQDLLNYINTRGTSVKQQEPVRQQPAYTPVQGEDRVVEMDRIRQLIASHMVRSVQTSPHVTSFIEVDMTKIVNWREKYKAAFQARQNLKLTFTPVIIEALARAVKDFPMVNVSVDGTKIIYHNEINIGMAVSLPNFKLIVPVIKNADQKSLFGIQRDVTDLAERARASKLKPDEIMGGTISLTNLGSFGNLAGTPIINQPQTAIIAVGSIKKRPVVIETQEGDVIAIRHMMILSITYDHRVIDGALGGQFLNKMVFYLENFDTNQNI